MILDSRNWKKMVARTLTTEKQFVRVKFEGEYATGGGIVELRFSALRGKWKSEAVELNTETLVKLREEGMVKKYRVEILIPEGVEIRLKKLEIKPTGRYSLLEKEDLKRDFRGEILAIVSEYETPNRKGANRRAAQKIRNARNLGEKIDLVVANNSETRLMRYKLGEEKVNKVSFNDLRLIMARGNYKKIILFSETMEIMNTILACDLDEKEVLVDSQGDRKVLWRKDGDYNRLRSPKAKGRKRQKSLLSIIMRAYNVEDYIENAVKSVVDIRNINLVEVIIVDDGSTDGTGEVVQRILEEASPEIREAIVYKKQENMGVAGATNTGISLATGKYLKFVDPDDRVDSDEFDEHIEVLKKTDADVVLTNRMVDYSVGAILAEDCRYTYMEPGKVYKFKDLCKKYPSLEFSGPAISLVTVKTDRLKEVRCELPVGLPSEDQMMAVYWEAVMDTILLDDRFLFYYLAGREGQLTEWEYLKATAKNNVEVMRVILELLKGDLLDDNKKQHFIMTRFKNSVHDYLYTMALDVLNSYELYGMIEEVLKKYPDIYNKPGLPSGVVKRTRRFGYGYFWVRRAKRRIAEFRKLYL